MMSEITQFLISHGGLILFAIVFGEQVGLPLPAAPWVIAAGALAASGKFSLFTVIGWTALGSVAADAISFVVGYRGQTRVFRFFPHLQAVRVKLERATLARTVLHGTRMLTVAKFVPLGNLIPIHAGALHVGRLRFLLVDAFCAVIYSTVYAALGFAFSDQLEQVVVILRRFGTASLMVIAFLVGAYVVNAFRKHHPASRKTEAVP